VYQLVACLAIGEGLPSVRFAVVANENADSGSVIARPPLVLLVAERYGESDKSAGSLRPFEGRSEKPDRRKLTRLLAERAARGEGASKLIDLQVQSFCGDWVSLFKRHGCSPATGWRSIRQTRREVESAQGPPPLPATRLASAAGPQCAAIGLTEGAIQIPIAESVNSEPVQRKPVGARVDRMRVDGAATNDVPCGGVLAGARGERVPRIRGLVTARTAHATLGPAAMWLYDVFICHASEDKDDFVRPLAEALRDLHVEVWYDEFTLRLGDGLRRSIDRGLARSRYGVVVLSRHFFEKNWPQRELDGLVARETARGDIVILPVWHGVDRDEVLEFSPPLADAVAVDSSLGVGEVANRVAEIVRPRTSPLVQARDILLDTGVQPPVVTDEWWLDVVEASNREYPWGYVPHREHWGRWSFWLPGDDGNPESRGERLARTALQMAWCAEADAIPITQLTRPEMALDFIASQKGLAETCHEQPRFLAIYAPQLTIRGFSGEFDTDFDELLAESCAKHDARRSEQAEREGPELAVEMGVSCDEWIALRHPAFGGSPPIRVAGQFVMGDVPGPPVKCFEQFEYVAWILSEASEWLPETVRATLAQGLAEWPVWPWYEFMPGEGERGLSDYPGRGALSDRLSRVKGLKTFKMTKACWIDLRNRAEDARRILALPETAAELAERFVSAGFIDGYFARREWTRNRIRH